MLSPAPPTIGDHEFRCATSRSRYLSSRTSLGASGLTGENQTPYIASKPPVNKETRIVGYLAPLQ